MATRMCKNFPEVAKEEFGFNELFLPLFTEIVQSNELLSSPKIKQIIGKDAVKNLRSNKEPDTVKVKQIIDLISQSDTPNRRTALVSVLKEDCDFTFVPDILFKHYKADIEIHLRKVVEFLKDTDNDIRNISGVLRTANLLTEVNVQDIYTELINRNSKAALVVLIDRVVTLEPESWFTKFLDCLKQVGMDDAVNKIEAEFDINGDMSECSHPGMEVPSDDYWRKLIMVLFHGQIVKIVTPSGLLTNLGTLFDLADKRAIRSLEKTESPQIAMAKLLEILDGKECHGKWQIFKQALVEDNYEWVKDCIEGEFVSHEDNEKWETLINLFEKTLSEKIRPKEILPWLRQQGIINEKDSQEVEQIYTNYGENEAVFRLLTFLPKRKPYSWYPEFMEILYKNGCDETVREIDPDIYKKLIQAHCPMIFDMDETMELETTVKNSSEQDLKGAYLSATEVPTCSKYLSSTLQCNDIDDPLTSTMKNINKEDDDEIPQKFLAKSKLGDLNILSEREPQLQAMSESGQIELNSLIVENIQKEMGLDVCPIDLQTRNIETPLENEWTRIEQNTSQALYATARPKPSSAHSDEIYKAHLGGNYHVIVKKFYGKHDIHIRRFWKPGDTLQPTKKGVVLGIPEWLNLESSVNTLDLLLKQSVAGDLKGERRFHLGRAVYATVNPSYHTVDIRRFWIPPGKGKKLTATRKGVSLNNAQWDVLKNVINSIRGIIPYLD